MVTSCDQEPLFWDIANEYPPIVPYIKGHPSQIVKMGTTLYITNSTTYKYEITASNVNWESMRPQPPGKTKALAAAGSTLYALSQNGTKIWAFNGSGWSDFYTANNMVNIFGAGTCIFVGIQTGDIGSHEDISRDYAILVLNSAGSELDRIPDTGLLRGAVFPTNSIYYVGTQGGGVYSGSNPAALEYRSAFHSTILGMTQYGAYAYAISPRNIQYSNNGTAATPINDNDNFTGAVSAWTDGTNHLLLAGIQSYSQYGNGYREIELSSAGIPQGDFNNPGEAHPSSVKIGSQYISAITKRAINFFYVMDTPSASVPAADDGDADYSAPKRPVIFASTIKDGLWSYRTRKGRAQWNGEDNSAF